MAATTFLLFKDLAAPINALSDADAGKLIKAIFAYENGESIPEMAPAVKVSFTFIKQQLERSQENYEAICERNRINGLKGGRPPKPKEPTGLSGFEKEPNLTQANPTEPRITLPNPNPNPKRKDKNKNLAKIDPDDIPGFDKAVAIPEPKEICAEDGAVDLALYTAVKESCEAVDGDFTDYGKEGRAIHGLIKKARIKNKDDPSAFLKTLLETFLRLRQNGREYWQSMPYTPSRINASGVFDGIVRQMEMDRESGAMEIDEDIAAILGGFYK